MTKSQQQQQKESKDVCTFVGVHEFRERAGFLNQFLPRAGKNVRRREHDFVPILDEAFQLDFFEGAHRVLACSALGLDILWYAGLIIDDTGVRHRGPAAIHNHDLFVLSETADWFVLASVAVIVASRGRIAFGVVAGTGGFEHLRPLPFFFSQRRLLFFDMRLAAVFVGRGRGVLIRAQLHVHPLAPVLLLLLLSTHVGDPVLHPGIELVDPPLQLLRSLPELHEWKHTC